MRRVTASEMQAIDQKAISVYGIPSLDLMERAGRGIAEMISEVSYVGRAGIFAGKGNNGGDGLVIARYLSQRNFQVEVFLFADPAHLKSDAAINYEKVRQLNIPVTVVDEKTDLQALRTCTDESDVIVDALLGVGLTGEVTGIYRTAVETINSSGRTIVSVDIPSGLHADTGEVLGVAVMALYTATLGLPKQGLYLKDGPAHCGDVRVIDIGIPKDLLEG